MIRRLKKDILADLPKKIRKIISVEVLNPKVKAELRGLLDIIKDIESKKDKKKRRKLSIKEKQDIANDTDDDEDSVELKRDKV
jgi:hypothetical protein